MTREVTVMNINPFGIMDYKVRAGITLFPNPNIGSFTVILKNLEKFNATLEVYSLSGSIIYQQPLDEEKTQIYLTQQAKGVYFYRISYNTKQTYNGKLIIE